MEQPGQAITPFTTQEILMEMAFSKQNRFPQTLSHLMIIQMEFTIVMLTDALR